MPIDRGMVVLPNTVGRGAARQVSVLQAAAVYTQPLLFATAFMCLCSVVIALFKVLPPPLSPVALRKVPHARFTAGANT